MKKKSLTAILLCLGFTLLFCACGNPGKKSNTIGTTQYPDPPESERMYTLSIYWEFNTGGTEYSGFAFSEEGIIEAGVREDPNAPSPDPNIVPDDSVVVIEDIVPPGGALYDFRGVAPGDVVLTISSKSEEGDKLMDEGVYVIRVYDDLTLAVLNEARTNYR